MAVAAATRPVVHGLPSPRSPTLSDAGMILPDNDASHVRSLSPNPYVERPPSPPVLHTNIDSSHVKLASAPQSRRRTSHLSKPPLSAQSSRSTLRNMGDSGAAATYAPARDDPLASSPTIQNGLSSNSPKNWNAQDQRRLSNASSMRSEDFDNWPGFDSHDKFDDSGLGLEEQENRYHFNSDSNHDEMEGDRWLNRHSSGSDESDDPYSSAALSRRAEIILANAKKRLNVMEGNLRGARESLVVSPTSNATRSSSELSLHLNTARERDRRLYAGLGPIPPRMPSFRSSPLSPSSPGHARGQSETSVPLPFSSPAYMTRHTSNKRASSAFGHTSGPWSPEGFGQGRFPIKESRSYETMREPRKSPVTNEQQWPVRTNSRNSKSPPALETLQEDEDGPRVHRSSSAASGLRDQMNDLKGRISSLKLRAQEDQLRRRSMQSLRTPSPFTNAQEWYTGNDAYHAGGAPVTTNAGLGIKTESPTRRAVFEEDHIRPQIAKITVSQREGENLVLQDTSLHNGMTNGHSEQVPYHDVVDKDFDDLDSYDDEQDFDETDERDFLTADEDEEQTGESVYEDAVYEMPATERHEDRVDAFDYEHFFLHSAMGTYSLEGRRSSSVGSDSSTETTRPVTAVQNHDDEVSSTEKRVSYHSRNASADSISTLASFATAAENQSDDEEENEQMDQFSEQILAQQLPIAQRPITSGSFSTLRSDSAINMRSGNGSSPSQTLITRGSSSPADLASGLQVSKIFSILTESSSPSREEPRLALSEEEKQLIYSLAASFQQVCSNLQHTYGEQYERKAWRRRLDEARRVLNGEEMEDDDSF
ncbi:hypothetical protein EK21DRAFT_87611 [Setomelanomma holmii]|uniref:Uncharacterized protein n=1 Tax=Setomelanomma holmii TaxID=210430 RepID=A0A9P4HEA9_9PLEO|nr:hypothetical protein EK21DRAFT_87611 [Setomelanomma holmii]